MYKVRTDITEERRKQLNDAVTAVVPNKFSGYVTVQIVNGQARTVFQEKEDE